MGTELSESSGVIVPAAQANAGKEEAGAGAGQIGKGRVGRGQLGSIFIAAKLNRPQDKLL